MPDQSRRQLSLVVAHPGVQHSYETALALQEAGLLHSYLTGFYAKTNGVWVRALARCRPIREGLLDRHKEELANDLVHQYPLGEIVYLALSRWPLLAKYADEIIRWRNTRFDKIVEAAIRVGQPAAVICYDTCALHSFRAARELGSRCILDQSVGHPRALLELMREEAELNPEFADSIQINLPEWFLAQLDEEISLAELILIGSDYARDTMVRHGVEPARMVVVHYGADLERFRPTKHAHRDRFRVLFVGQLSQRKGIKYLLQAVKELAMPQLQLVLVGGVVGSGSGLAEYRDYFRHVPNVSHATVHEYFQDADLFVYPSLHEGSAIAIYEALASGLPVITTANSGSVVRDRSEGFIVPIRDTEALKEKILLLYERRELREEMSFKARTRATQFSWRAYRSNLSRLLRRMLVENNWEQPKLARNCISQLVSG